MSTQNPSLSENPVLAQLLAINVGKQFLDLSRNAGVVGLDLLMDQPQVQMRNLKALREITGGVKLKLERQTRYARYHVVLNGVEFFFMNVRHSKDEIIQ